MLYLSIEHHSSETVITVLYWQQNKSNYCYCMVTFYWHILYTYILLYRYQEISWVGYEVLSWVQKMNDNTCIQRVIFHMYLYDIYLSKGHLRSTWPLNNVHNISLEWLSWLTIFSPALFSYTNPSRSFMCISNFNPLLHYWVTM